MVVTTMAAGRIHNLDALRALAALAVCFYHFRREDYLGLPLLTEIFSYGHLGVHVFFVISGFVIPLSLTQIRFRWSDLSSFLASRFFRLYPAYVGSALLAVALWYGSSWLPGFRGQVPEISASQLLANFTLSCDFVGEAWFIPVYWTLAIEAQFYLLIALSFPLLEHRQAAVRWMALATWILAPLLVGTGPSILSWTALFALGILVYFRWERKLFTWPGLLAGFAACAVQGWVWGLSSLVVGAATALAILYLPPIRFRPLLWIGTISYSLYLLHAPIGGRVINFAERYELDLVGRVAVFGVALTISVLAAAVFYYLIEQPSHQLSRRVKRKRV